MNSKKRGISLAFILSLCISLSLVLPASAKESLSDEELLDLIQRKSFEYFVFERNPATGLVRDRASNISQGSNAPASIAAVGYALTAYPVGVSRNWIDYGTAKNMTLVTLRFFLNEAPQEHGFFYHFMDMESGRRASSSELSPIDTALFLAGALFAAEYYDDPEIRDLARKIYERVDWPWMLHGGKTFAMAWSPEAGFERGRWDTYNESMIMYLLAIGSPTHPVPADSWHAILRPKGSYGGYRMIQHPPLFTHQYSHIWVDFRNKHDDYADYFRNSIEATLANRAFCIDQSARFKSYGENSWGLTASDGPGGYRAYGAPPGWSLHDGTLAPTGCIGSIVFTPQESIACARNFYENVDKVWGRYGFADAFNLDKKWMDTEVIAIDQGTILLMIENYRTEMIWNVMSKNQPLQQAMKDAGFKSGQMEISWPEPPEYEAAPLASGIHVDGFLKDWPHGKSLKLDLSSRESGNFDGDKDLGAEIRLAWDKQALYFYVKVTDDSLVAKRTGKNIWQDDIVEFYVDPDSNGLFWEREEDFQIGFRPVPGASEITAWSWFGRNHDPVEQGMAAAAGFTDGGGYLIEGAILWEYLGIKPEQGKTLGFSVAVHDADQDRSQGKLHWFFRNEDQERRFVLGKVKLA